MAAFARDILTRDIEKLGLALSEAQLQCLKEYCTLLVKWNKSVNLISRKDIDRLVPRHILDSLSGHRWIDGPEVLDVGSGAGLPGIPLAVAMPTTRFTLCERMARRARFLGLAARELGLANVVVEDQDVRTIEQQEFNSVVARAVEEPLSLWQLVRDRLPLGGRLVVYSHTQTADLTAGAAAGVEDGEVVYHRVTVPGMKVAHTICTINKVT